jgi:hypothetical protein
MDGWMDEGCEDLGVRIYRNPLGRRIRGEERCGLHSNGAHAYMSMAMAMEVYHDSIFECGKQKKEEI